MTIMNIKGHRYGLLRVVKQAESKPGQGASWQCRCDCGNITVARAKDIKDGNTRSCGCARRFPRNNGYGRWGTALTGGTFGLLTAGAKSKRKSNGGHTRYICDCDCGKKTVVRGTLLVNGQVRSCGHLRFAPRPAQHRRAA